MADPTTANTSMFVPIRGADVGAWDVPVNSNFNVLDAMFGGVQIYTLTNSNVTMTTSGAQNSIIRLTGTLTASVSITLAGINKFWNIDNQLTNSPSSFIVTMLSTSGSNQIGVPPGTQIIYYDGTTIRFIGPDRIGSYWDYAGPVQPNWLSNCTTPPYLNCDGTTFSSATYPVLANLLGTTTLPDSRGRHRLALNQGTGRVTSAGGGVDGNTLSAGGGVQQVTIVTGNLPAYTPSGTVNISQNANIDNAAVGVGAGAPFAVSTAGAATITATFTGNAQGGFSAPIATMNPTYVGGFTFLRAV